MAADTQARTRVLLATLLLTTLLLTGLAACAGGSPSPRATPTVTALTPGGITPVAGANSATPTQYVIGGTGSTVGVSDICVATPDVQQGLPTAVPAYPGAELRQGYSAPGGSTYGLCAQASAGEIAAFYAGKLSGAGWQSVKSVMLPLGQQVTASRSGATLAITILPDVARSGWTNVLVVISTQ